MSLLSSGDLSRILSAVELLNSDTSPDTLPDRTLGCVSALIPNELCIFDGFDTVGEYTGYHWYSPPGSIEEAWVARLGEVIHEHPIHQDVLTQGKEITFRISDFVSLPKFHRTALYNDVYRNVGGDSQMGTAMVVTPTTYVTQSMYREGMDFTEAEVEMLRMVAPHLKAAFRNARAIDLLGREKKYLSAVATKGLLVLDGDGNVVFQTELAQDLIQKYFLEVEKNGLPGDLNRYLREIADAAAGEEYYQPPEPLRFVDGDRELKINVTIDAVRRELTLVLEEKVGKSPSDYECLGLTPRESETLYWISRGKTNPEIAMICEISPRTVHKHVENILNKFGVETRTAAVVHANGKIG